MELYWNTRPNAPAQVHSPSQPDVQDDDDSLASEYDRIRQAQMLAQGDEGWQAELRRYLKYLPPDVSPSTDLIAWWQVSQDPRALLYIIILVF
jgi:hypothetical protein